MLTDDELARTIGDAGLAELDRNISLVASSVVRGAADFLAGAGMSRDAGLPTGAGLAATLLRTAYPQLTNMGDDEMRQLASTHPFESVVGAIESVLPRTRTSLESELTRIFEPGGVARQPGPSHQQFARLAGTGRGRIRRVFTTNFDRMFEAVLGPDDSVSVTESNSKDYEDALHRNVIPVVHLHGTFDKDLQISESDVADTTNYWSVNTIFMNRLLAAETVTFVGYSMADPDLARVYRTYRDLIRLRQMHDRWCYVVTPVSTLDEYLLTKDVWKARGGALVPIPSADFFERLVDAVDMVEDRERADLLMNAYGWSNSELAERIRKVGDALDLKDQADAQEVLLQLLRLRGDET